MVVASVDSMFALMRLLGLATGADVSDGVWIVYMVCQQQGMRSILRNQRVLEKE